MSRCSRFRQRGSGGRRDGRRAIAGAKMRVGKFVHFSGNASPPRGGKVTRDRQDTYRAARLCDRVFLPVYACRTIPKRRQPDSYGPSPLRPRPRHPRTFPPPLYSSARFITFAIFRRGARPKVANAGITREKAATSTFRESNGHAGDIQPGMAICRSF